MKLIKMFNNKVKLPLKKFLIKEKKEVNNENKQRN